jgi:hypothetical protein
MVERLVAKVDPVAIRLSGRRARNEASSGVPEPQPSRVPKRARRRSGRSISLDAHSRASGGFSNHLPKFNASMTNAPSWRWCSPARRDGVTPGATHGFEQPGSRST